MIEIFSAIVWAVIGGIVIADLCNFPAPHHENRSGLSMRVVGGRVHYKTTEADNGERN